MTCDRGRRGQKEFGLSIVPWRRLLKLTDLIHYRALGRGGVRCRENSKMDSKMSCLFPSPPYTPPIILSTVNLMASSPMVRLCNLTHVTLRKEDYQEVHSLMA